MQQSFFLFNEPRYAKNDCRVLPYGLCRAIRGICIAFSNINRQPIVEWFKEQWNNIRLQTQCRFKP